MPYGTYKDRTTKVLVRSDQNTLYIHNLNKDLIAQHIISAVKGRKVLNADHRRDKEKGFDQLKENTIKLLGNNVQAQLYVQNIYRSKPRYLRDNLEMICNSITEETNSKIVEETLEKCLNAEILNGKDFRDILQSSVSQYYIEQKVEDDIISDSAHTNINMQNMEPERSNVSDYQNLFQ